MTSEVRGVTVTEEVFGLLQRHRSIRKFQDKPIPADILRQILTSAQMAPTSSHVQAYTIIGVTDQRKKELLAEYAGGQAYVATCAHFLVFCADLHRLERITEQAGVDARPALESTEKFIVATVDAALAAQNAAIAAEGAGLGIVYIGGIRNAPQEVSELLELPRKVYPVFGMCLGYPAQDPEVKPRLPLTVTYAENRYPDFEAVSGQIDDYDRDVQQYYLDRTKGKRDDTWTDMMSRLLARPSRTHMKSFLRNRGLPLE
jgi:FMN reductase (NADPH)